jgi:pyruvate/2-oxoglutarate dehydrogenase complex dihydrolipoamide acyltransferase (E2) component
MFSRSLKRPIAVGAAAVVVAIGGGYVIINATDSSSATSGTATAAPATAQATARGPSTARAPATAAPREQTTSSGQPPQGWSPGQGTVITGAAADKATAAAVAAHPEGTVNRVLQLSDGSYAVHRIGTTGQHHIFVSTDFKVTGTS